MLLGPSGIMSCVVAMDRDGGRIDAMRCEEEERDEAVCYYCQRVISLEIFPKSWQEQEH